MSAEVTGEVEGIIIPLDEVKTFITRCMTVVGAKQSHAEDLAELLAVADYRGHFSHGLNRLDMYVEDIKRGTVSNEEPVILKETEATAHVDGKNALGPAIGKFCIDLAIKKAKKVGIGWVVAKESNHFGIAGWYSIRACEQGLVGMALTNTSPLVVPTRARKATLGTNPISVAAPANNGDSFVLDMATSTVALGKIEFQDRKGESMPDGWGVDAAGKVSNNPREVLDHGGLMPLGGAEECGGYKGYGLAMMVEVFCGILAGASFGPNIRQWKTHSDTAHLGQCFVAIDPEAFAPGFGDRMSSLIDICRNLQPAEGETEVLVAGDPEKQHMEKCGKNGGIKYHPRLIEHMNELAKNLNVKPMQSL